MDDRGLIEGFLAGEAEAVEQLDQWIRDVVHSLYWGLRQHWEDIAQDVRRKLIENFRRERFESRSPLRFYVYKIAQLTCIDYLRRQYRQPDVESLCEELGPRDEYFDPDRWAERIDERRLFFKIFHALPDECRQLWRLLFLEGASYREAGERLHITEGTTRMRFHRCKQRALELYGKLTQASVKGLPKH
jgi:RNA polymerase sigma factor (sigma-70 family)